MTAGPAPQVVIVAGEFPPIGGGGVMRIVKLAKYLPAHGWRVTVICSDEAVAPHHDPALLEELPADVAIVRVRGPFGGLAQAAAAGAKTHIRRRSRLFRLLYWFRATLRSAIAIPDRWIGWALKVGFRSARSSSADVVLSSGPPHSDHVGGALLAARLRIPFVMDLRDEWSLRPSTRSRLPWRRLIESWLEARCIERAVKVVVVSEPTAERYRRRYPGARDRIAVIPNGFDPADIAEVAGDGRVPGSAAVTTIGYAGSFQPGLDLDPILRGLGDAVREADRLGFSVRLAFVGPIEEERLEATATIPPGAIDVSGFVPHREALRRMAGWDVLMIVADDGPASLAGKTYECLALRKPLLVVAPTGPATRLVEELEAGVAAHPRDAAAVRDAALQAVALARDGSFRGAPDGVLALYDRRRQAAEWSRILAHARDADGSSPRGSSQAMQSRSGARPNAANR